MKVSQLLHLLTMHGIDLQPHGLGGGFDPQLLRASFDSRAVRPGDLFCALGGLRADGRQYLSQAFEQGASAFLLQGGHRYGAVPHLVLDSQVSSTDVARAAGLAAHFLAGTPSEKMWIGAVTGTNGKSTVVHLVEQAMNRCGMAAAGGGTLGLRFGDAEHGVVNTTPSADLLHAWLAEVLHKGGEAALFEASSVGIEQERIAGVAIDCAAWTNLSHDHLDIHGTMAAYAAAKAKMFLELSDQAMALVPAEKELQALCSDSAATTVTWALHHDEADLRGICRSKPEGVHLDIRGIFGNGEIQSRLIGAHNAENLLLAFGMLRCAGIEPEPACEALAACTSVPGRLQRIAPEHPAHLFVDYAHSPEALDHVARALKEAYPEARLGVVFGAGGDRDKAKRAPMGAAVAKVADWCVITSDNPRSEEPHSIVSAVAEGVGAEESGCQAMEEVDRRAAIRLAVGRLQPGDVLLVAGKGHETYQEIEGVRHDFDDREVLAEAVACSI